MKAITATLIFLTALGFAAYDLKVESIGITENAPYNISVNISNPGDQNIIYPFNISFYYGKYNVPYTLESRSETTFEWYACNISNADKFIYGSDCTQCFIGNPDDGAMNYTLPWNFNYFGRNITSIGVGTNGYVELLEPGETPVYDNWIVHLEKQYLTKMDVVFISSGDLNVRNKTGIEYLAICNFTDKVVAEWYGTLHYNENISAVPLHQQLILYQNGNITWSFKNISPRNTVTINPYRYYYGDYFSGFYLREENKEVEIGYHVLDPKSYKMGGTTGNPVLFNETTVSDLPYNTSILVNTQLESEGLNLSGGNYYIEVIVNGGYTNIWDDYKGNNVGYANFSVSEGIYSKFIFTILNRAVATLSLTKIVLDGEVIEFSPAIKFSPFERKTITFDTTNIYCTFAGQLIQFENTSFFYTQGSIENIIQTGALPLILRCA